MSIFEVDVNLQVKFDEELVIEGLCKQAKDNCIISVFRVIEAIQCYHMKDSGLGVKTDTKNIVQKIDLQFQDMIFQGRRFRISFHPWMRTHEIKKKLVKQKFNDKNQHLSENDIRLFYKNIQLTQQNKNPFDLHKIEDGSTIVIMKNSNTNNTDFGVVNPYQLFQTVPQEITNLILNVQSGLNSGRKPKLAADGTSGTYFLENCQRKVAVFKPYDEEPYAPNNPRGYPGQIGSHGIRKGVLSGECATRQVASYMLDASQHFHGIPATTYTQFYHPCFNFKQFCETPIVSQKETNLNKAKTKHGSLQQFVEYNDVVGNLGSHQFDVAEVHKIAILDLRILNCDRNQANILVVKKSVSALKDTVKTTRLVPIDHGLSFPDNFQIYEYQLVWMGYKQAKVPFSEKQLAFIEAIDPVKDCRTLREKLGFREICLRNFRIAQMFLKKLTKAGFTLYEIGQFAYREDDSDWSESDEGTQEEEKKPAITSELQKLVIQAEFIYNTVKNNGIKSTAEFQMDLIKHKKHQGESGFIRKEFKQITSQQPIFGLGLTKKSSKMIKETSIEKKERVNSEHKRPRNISLPNLKKKPSNRNKRMKQNKRKTNEKGLKDKGQKWGQLFFHYIEELLDRFVCKKLQQKNKPKLIGRGRLMSQDIY